MFQRKADWMDTGMRELLLECDEHEAFLVLKAMHQLQREAWDAFMTVTEKHPEQHRTCLRRYWQRTLKNLMEALELCEDRWPADWSP